jgi:hypothetical protein
MTKWRAVDTNEEAVRLGFANVSHYRYAVRQEIEREKRQMYADAVARHQAELAEKLQQHGEKHIMRTSPMTPQQEAAWRARKAEQGEDR